MKIRNFEDLNLQEVDTMREISSIGTSHAATALSKFLQKEIRITLPQVSILGYEDAVDRIGNIEEVVAATLGKLLDKNYTSFEEMDALAYSALEEVGNIIICSYINAFSQLVDMNIHLSVPSSTVNMLGGILTVPIAEYGYETDKLMYFNADFVMEGKRLSDWLLMLPDIRSLNDILGKLGV